MERVLLFVHLFLLFPSNLPNPVKDPSEPPRAAGVFLHTLGGKYTLDLSAARAACLLLNVTIASIAQVERALQHGLETCKFGWTSDRIAVIPRLTADIKCGKGKTGVLTWATSEDQKFGVFCFDASDFRESLEKTSVAFHSSTCASTSLLQTSTSAGPPLTSSTGPSRTTTGPETPLTPAFTLLFQAATYTVDPLSSTPGKDFSTQDPTSATRPITSAPALLSSSSPTSVQRNLSVFSDSAVLLSTNAPEASLADLPTALIVLAGALTLLMAAGLVLCYKLWWFQRPQDDSIETEMWKHSESEVDLCSQREEGPDTEYSRDITLCRNPQFRMTSE